MPHDDSDRRVEVAIVGAGPVGLTLATLLGQQGVSAVVIERHDTTVVESRAAVLDGESIRILHATGLGEPLTGGMVTGFGHFSVTATGKPLLHVHPERRPHGHPFLTWIHQPDVENTLCEGLRRYPSVEVMLGRSVESIAQTDRTATVRGTTSDGVPFSFTADYVIGCDGANSTVRRLLDIPFDGSTYQERWLVVDWEQDRSALPGGSWFYTDPHGPAITARMPGGRRRWEFALRPDEKSGPEISDADALTDEYIASMIGRYTDPSAGTIARRTVYRFHDRRAQRWRLGRIMLAGDAAHLMPPFAGLGLNNGLRDAVNLGWKLRAVLSGASDALLDTYEAERRPIVTSATRMAVRVGRMTNARGKFVCALRDRVLLTAETIPLWRKTLRNNAFDPWPKYHTGLVSEPRCRHAGALLPQPAIETNRRGSGTEPIDLDTLIRGRFTLLADMSAINALSEAALSALQRAGIRVLSVTNQLPPASDPALPVEFIRDYGALDTWLGRHRDHVLLVRPDAFVYGCFSPDDIDHKVASLIRALGLTPGECLTAAGELRLTEGQPS